LAATPLLYTEVVYLPTDPCHAGELRWSDSVC